MPDLYELLLTLHILCAVIGFGGVFLNGAYGAHAKRVRGPGGLAIIEANLGVSRIAEVFIYLVFLFGLGLVFETSVERFSEFWLSASMGLYILGIGLSHGLLQPNARKIRDLTAEVVAAGPPGDGPPPQAAAIEAAGKKVAITGGVLNVLLVVVLALMVWKPGA